MCRLARRVAHRTGSWCRPIDADSLQLRLREKADVLSVGRPERFAGILGARQRLRRGRREDRIHSSRRPPFVTAKTSRSPSGEMASMLEGTFASVVSAGDGIVNDTSGS